VVRPVVQAAMAAPVVSARPVVSVATVALVVLADQAAFRTALMARLVVPLPIRLWPVEWVAQVRAL
jgi:hypothetical protein